MQIQKNISLLPYNTFGIDVKSDFFIHIESEQDIIDFINSPIFKNKTLLILGGGSNVLLTKDFNGIVLFNQLKGIKSVPLQNDKFLVTASAGENWHQLVLKSLELGLNGLENLSLIPGSVGAAPMQNIGAYGAEIKDTFHALKAINLNTGEKREFNLFDCKFGYRESVFKNSEKGKWFITEVSFLLSNSGNVNLSYGAIQEVLNQQGIMNPTPKDVSNAVIEIRQSKLPNPKELGNSGSFFKNPEIEIELLNKLKKEYPFIPFYPLDSGRVKIPAGWLIETSGWKGKRVGNTGSHAKQALVLVNYGNATGSEVIELARAIQDDINHKFGIFLEMEVNIV